MILSPDLREVADVLRADFFDNNDCDPRTTSEEFAGRIAPCGDFVTMLDDGVSPLSTGAINYLDAKKLVADLVADVDMNEVDETKYIVGQRSLLGHVTAYAEMLSVDIEDPENVFCIKAVFTALANDYYGGRYSTGKTIIWTYDPKPIEGTN